MTGDDPPLTDRQREFLQTLPATDAALADALGIATSTVADHRANLQAHPAVTLTKGEDGRWRATDAPEDIDTTQLPSESDEPDTDDLTPRETYVLRQLQTGATAAELANDLDSRPAYVKQTLAELKDRGWPVYEDADAGHYAIEGDHPLRSSEHIGTRTRRANKWWELRHNELVREFRTLETPATDRHLTPGWEDWVLHLTDVHVGDRVRDDSGEVIYDTDTAAASVDYVTDKALQLAAYHGAYYDAAHIIWGGDMITNEGIYEGQFEDLDAWLDEQLDAIVGPLLRQVRAFAAEFETVRITAQTGNHGEMRASGVSRQANADLILYKHLRNLVAAITETGDGDPLDNVSLCIGEAKPYRNVHFRDGAIRAHVRHGDTAKPQAQTAAGKRDWRGWRNDHDFDVAYCGHYHISKREDVDGYPVFFSGSPKPADGYVESLGGRPTARTRQIATAHGVDDDGVTCVFPIDTRDFDQASAD